MASSTNRKNLITMSMPQNYHNFLKELHKVSGLNRSDLCRQAIREWAERNCPHIKLGLNTQDLSQD